MQRHSRLVRLNLVLVSLVLFCPGRTSVDAQRGTNAQDLHGALLHYRSGSSLRTADGRWRTILGYDVPAESRTVVSSSPIGIIDSGISLEHPQVPAHAILAHMDFTGEGIQDYLGHGTVIAIIAGGREVVTLPLLVAKVASIDGRVSYRAVLEAVRWIVDRGATVVNMSLGFDEREGDYSELCYVIESSSDTLFIAAAGNSGPGVKFYPAACEVDNVLCTTTMESSVGACDSGIVVPETVRLREP